ncbi:MAG: inosine-5-monophosphate dehydrogenase [Proteobacteria bacterium]|nr:MAG: inosine-5-monophosphate dehydrogenase [Pseudomonadota bacterium]
MDQELQSLTGKFGTFDPEVLAWPVSKLDPPLPLTVTENSSLLETIGCMKKHHIGSILVVNGGNELTGIFSERDVLTKVILSELELDATPIKSVMTCQPRVETPCTSIAFVMRLMVEGGFRHVPLVNESKQPIGIISIKDILDFIEMEMVKHAADSELNS